MTHHPSTTGSYDPASVAGKQPPIPDETDLLIVGAGPAGLAAARAAAGRGIRVTLVDENPVPLDTMAEEVPLHFGNRMSGVAASYNNMLEAVLDARPELVDLLEAGVEVRLGTSVWGLFPRHPGAAWIDGAVAGLADAQRTSLLRFRQAIVAAGRRDMGLAFEGWSLPGVMGASAAWRLAVLYGALDAKRVVQVGGETESLLVAQALRARGVEIVAVVEQAPTIPGAPELVTSLREAGTACHTGHIVRRASGDATGVTSVEIAKLDAQGQPDDSTRRVIACDTVMLGIAALPAIELLEAAGCRTMFSQARSGHIADVDDAQRTSLPGVLAAGDCTGIWPSKSLDEGIARREGERAAATALQALGVEDGPSLSNAPDAIDLPDTSTRDIAAARIAWVQASVVAASGTPFVCQCEEVTAREILDVQPPRYLGWHAMDQQHSTRGVAGLATDGPPNPDAVKRLTRACMGPCQGRRCREQVAALLAIGSACSLPEIPLATFRAPVRPLSLQRLAEVDEAPSLAEHWDSWFGMAPQWVPFWRVEPLYRATTREHGGPVSSE